MYRKFNSVLRLFLFAVISCAAVFAVSCSKPPQPSNTSSTSAPSAATPAGSDFEGTIAMKLESDSQPQGMEMTYFLKGRQTRIETKVPSFPGGEVVMLWDLDGEKIITLMPSRKTYMTMDLKETAEGMQNAEKEVKKSRGEEDEKFPMLTPTGKKETIAGYACEHWLMGDNQEVDMCVAKGLGYFGMGGNSGRGLGTWKNLAFSPKLLAEAASRPDWVKFLEGGAFPLKLTTMEDGKVTMNMEATKIEKKALDDSLFTIPRDYKELSIPSMTGGKQ